MENNHQGLPFEELFNWQKLFDRKVTDVSQFRLIRSHPFIYVFRRRGDEFELSRGYAVTRTDTKPFPWKFDAGDLFSKLVGMGDFIHGFSIVTDQETNQNVGAMEIKFDFYKIRYEDGRFYFPVTHSYLINARPYMAILTQIVGNKLALAS